MTLKQSETETAIRIIYGLKQVRGEYSRTVPYIIAPYDAITVTKDEYNKLLKKLKFYDFKEIECVYY